MSLNYFFLIRHGIYLSTNDRDDGLLELGKQQALAAVETLDRIFSSSTNFSNFRFTDVIQSGYRRTYETGLIIGQRLESMNRLEKPLEKLYQIDEIWSEIRSIERFRSRWKRLDEKFFSSSSFDIDQRSKSFLIFSHGNLLTSIVRHLTSMKNSLETDWIFGNAAPHCSVSVLSYRFGDALPQIVFSPFQLWSQSLPITINNVNPKKIPLQSFIPERVVGSRHDQMSLVSKYLPANDDEKRRIQSIFEEFYRREKKISIR